MVAVSAWLRETLPADVILTNGAGNFTVWPNKFFKFGPQARLLARAQVDAELALALARTETERSQAQGAIDKLNQVEQTAPQAMPPASPAVTQ